MMPRRQWRSKKVKEEEKIFDDLYLAEVKGRNRTSDGDFTTVGNQDLQEINNSKTSHRET